MRTNKAGHDEQKNYIYIHRYTDKDNLYLNININLALANGGALGCRDGKGGTELPIGLSPCRGKAGV